MHGLVTSATCCKLGAYKDSTGLLPLSRLAWHAVTWLILPLYMCLYQKSKWCPLQIGVTALDLLGLDYTKLIGAAAEGTKPLPGLTIAEVLPGARPRHAAASCSSGFTHHSRRLHHHIAGGFAGCCPCPGKPDGARRTHSCSRC